MAGGPAIPGPPTIPPLPSALPMAGPPVMPQQQHHQAPHVVQQQAPFANNMHQPGFQGQHGQGGGGGNGFFGQGQGNAQKQNQNQNQQKQRTSFKYFQLRKPSMRDVETGVRPTWAMSKLKEVSVTSTEIEEKVRQLRAKSKATVSDEYDALSSAQKEKVDQLLNQHKTTEKDPTMEWNIAAIGVEKRRVSFGVFETTQVKVYIKRSLRAGTAGTAGTAGNKDKASGGAQFGMGGMNNGGAQFGMGAMNNGGAQHGMGGMNQAGAPKQGQMPMQNMPMQNMHMGNQQGGFQGVPHGAQNMMPNAAPHMQYANAGAHMQHQNVAPGLGPGPVPANVSVLDPSLFKHSKHGKHRRKRSGKSKRDRRHRRDRDRDSQYDSEDSDSSSRSSLTAAGDHNEKIEDLCDEIKDLRFDLRRKERRESRPYRRRWSASASQLPRVPIGKHREAAHDYNARNGGGSMGWRTPVYEPRHKPSLEKVHHVVRERKIHHYQSPDESDGLTDRSGPSIESWMTGSSGFSRPTSDPPYSPAHSPGPRRSRDSFFREHAKPPRVGYHTPPRSPLERGSAVAYSLEPEGRRSQLYLVEPERRSSRLYAPDLVERRSSKVYAPLSSERRTSKVYLSDLSEKRGSRRYLPVLERGHTYDGEVGRKTSFAEDYMMAQERRPGRKDSWRRLEEDRYRGDDRYYGRSHR